jgi:hypothetical protein
MKHSRFPVTALVLTVSLRQAVRTARVFKLCTAFGASEKLGIDFDRLSLDLDGFTGMDNCYLTLFFTSRANSFHGDSVCNHFASNIISLFLIDNYDDRPIISSTSVPEQILNVLLTFSILPA